MKLQWTDVEFVALVTDELARTPAQVMYQAFRFDRPFQIRQDGVDTTWILRFTNEAEGRLVGMEFWRQDLKKWVPLIQPIHWIVYNGTWANLLPYGWNGEPIQEPRKREHYYYE
jgi:hypothetical protein